MTVRRLTPDDAPAWRALRLRGLREHPVAFTSSAEEDERQPPEAARARLASPDARFWGAFDDAGQLVGIVGLERERRAKSRHKATVVGMYVAAEWVGHGYGRALLRALVAEAEAQGLASLVLTVTEGDGPARRLYEAMGFLAFGTEPHAIVVDGHAHAKVHMVRLLAPPKRG